MKSMKLLYAVVVSILTLSLTSCEKDNKQDPPATNNDPLKSYVNLGSESLFGGSHNLQLFMSEDPFVGYNKVAARLVEAQGEKVVSNAKLEFIPVMDMGGMIHGSPVEQAKYVEDMNAHMGGATLVMPSTAGTWSFDVVVATSENSTDTAHFEVQVVEKSPSRLYSFVSPADSNDSYFVALRSPKVPEVGMNDFEIMIYKKESMMSFPPDSTLTVQIETLMPGMGHGSPNNVNPIYSGNGLYSGKVNFTMSGDWQVGISISDQNSVSLDDDGIFEFTVK